MTKQMPIPLDLAFVPADTLTFENLIQKIPTQKHLSPERQRDMISGLKRVASALGLPPSDVPCDGRWLQPRLARISPAMIGMKLKTWQNAVSNVRSAMACFGIVERRSRVMAELDANWRPLWETILASKDPTLPTALRRFVHFLNRMYVAPAEVQQTHADAFHEALKINEIIKNPDVAFRTSIDGWNLARRRIPNWPNTVLTSPSKQILIRFDDTEFPLSFVNDVDALMARLAAPDPLADTGPTRALRPVTVSQYRRQIMRFASEVVRAGADISSIKDVPSLLSPETAERGLRQMLSRNQNSRTKGISETAALLRNLGRILNMSKETREALTALARKVATKPQKGMTPKNRARLRVLQEPKHRQRIFTLPDRVFNRTKGDKRQSRSALAREDAMAIAILLVCPVRVKNLAALQLDLHIQRPGDGRSFLVLEDQDTKTGQPIEFELPADVVKLMEVHLATRSPWMCPAGTPFLFPRRNGQAPVHPTSLASRISKRVYKETGFVMNAHLFRHFAVMNWLDANPGGYEVARRLLGHSELSHTINMYSGLEIKSATRAFSDLIDKLKDA